MGEELAQTSGTLSRIYNTGDINSTFITNVGTGLGAAPTAQVTLTAVAGTASTVMRSDAAPPLSQAIAPTMTAAWKWTPSANAVPVTINAPAALSSANMQVWSPLTNATSVVTKNGDFGVGEPTPTANVSIKQRVATIQAISPLAWFRAEDYDGSTTWSDNSGNGYHLTAHGSYEDGAVHAVRPRQNAASGVADAVGARAPRYLASVDTNFNAGIAGAPDLGRQYAGWFQFDTLALPAVGATLGLTIAYITRDWNTAATGGTTNFLLGAAASVTEGTCLRIDSGPPSTRMLTAGSTKNFCANQASYTDNNDSDYWICRIPVGGTGIDCTRNGTLLTNGETDSATGLVFTKLFRSSAGWNPPKKISICEMIIFNKALTTAEMVIVNDYLASRLNSTPLASGAQPLTDWKDINGVVDSVVDSSINFGVGTSSPSTKLHVVDTAEQIRIGYSSTNYLKTTVSSAANCTYDLVASSGTPAFTFADPVNITGALTVTGNITGTNLNVNGAVVYSSGTALALTAAGSTGQLLRSAGAASPTWTTATFPVTAGAAANVLRSDGTNWSSSTLAAAGIVSGSGTDQRLLKWNGTGAVAADSHIAEGVTGAFVATLDTSYLTTNRVYGFPDNIASTGCFLWGDSADNAPGLTGVYDPLLQWRSSVADGDAAFKVIATVTTGTPANFKLQQHHTTGVVTVTSVGTNPNWDWGATPIKAGYFNNVVITTPASAAQLTLGSGKTIAISNTLTFTGTDASSVAFGAGGTVLYGNQSITLSGDVSGTGTTAITTAIGAGKVTLAMQANMATSSLVYRKTAGSGAPEVNTLATLSQDLGVTQRTGVADLAYSMVSTDFLISYTSLTAARIVTLLAASTLAGGRKLWIVDASGSATATNTISIAPNGADTIDGSNTTQVVINQAYGGVIIETNGTNGWFVRKLSLTGEVTASAFIGNALSTSITRNITPTWTGVHTFSSQDVHSAGILVQGTTSPQLINGYDATNRMEWATDSLGGTVITPKSATAMTTAVGFIRISPSVSSMSTTSKAWTFRVDDLSGNQRFWVGRVTGANALNHGTRFGFDDSNYLQFSAGAAAGGVGTFSLVGLTSLTLPNPTTCAQFTASALTVGNFTSTAATGTNAFVFNTTSARTNGFTAVDFQDNGSSVLTVTKVATGSPYLMSGAVDLKLTTAGNGFYVKEGTNATMGVVTLVAGVAVVSTTKVTATSRILLTRQTVAGTVGSSVDVTARTAGTSFTITANGSILDTSTVAWLIMEPG